MAFSIRLTKDEETLARRYAELRVEIGHRSDSSSGHLDESIEY